MYQQPVSFLNLKNTFQMSEGYLNIFFVVFIKLHNLKERQGHTEELLLHNPLIILVALTSLNKFLFGLSNKKLFQLRHNHRERKEIS
jgi:hypothetical protein